MLISEYSSSRHELSPTFWLCVITVMPDSSPHLRAPWGAVMDRGFAEFFGTFPEDTRLQSYRVCTHYAQPTAATDSGADGRRPIDQHRVVNFAMKTSGEGSSPSRAGHAIRSSVQPGTAARRNSG